MVSSLNPCAAAMLAKLCRRVWGVTPSKPARALLVLPPLPFDQVQRGATIA